MVAEVFVVTGGAAKTATSNHLGLILQNSLWHRLSDLTLSQLQLKLLQSLVLGLSRLALVS